MKKIVFVIFLMFAFWAANAQKINFGPRVALLSSKISLDNPVSNFSEGKAQLGYQLGAFLRLKLLGVYVQPEFLFSKTKSAIELTGTGTQKFNFNKIDLPVMLGYKLGPLRLQAGPSFSFLMSAESTDPGKLVKDVKENYNATTVGYQVGIGVDILRFVIDLKYEDNLSKFANALPTGINSDQRQNQFVFALGFKLF